MAQGSGDIIITSEDLRARLASDFGGQGGGSRLAGRLGVSPSTASNLLTGNRKSSLIKVAALYGYDRHDRDTWIASATPRSPQDVGYKHRWTDLVIAELRTMMSQPKATRPRTSDVAKRMGISQVTLRGAMARSHIKLRSGDRS